MRYRIVQCHSVAAQIQINDSFDLTLKQLGDLLDDNYIRALASHNTKDLHFRVCMLGDLA
ncbi:hypothetical protein D3C86_2240730 [compost metagenome]